MNKGHKPLCEHMGIFTLVSWQWELLGHLDLVLQYGLC